MVREGDVVKGMESMELSVDFEPAKILDLLRGFLRVQQRRAEAYARLHRGYLKSSWKLRDGSNPLKDGSNLLRDGSNLSEMEVTYSKMAVIYSEWK